jgi:hypothetical protein
VNRNRWIVIIGCTVLALIAIAVSVFVGGGWALILVELVAVGLIVVLFLRGQSGDEDPEPGDE